LQFRYFEVATRPRLAWCARITRADDTVAVFHGSRVETRARGFVQGAWSGPFDAFDLAGATVVCGTGGVADADEVRFSTSTEQESPLFGVRDGHAVHVSFRQGLHWWNPLSARALEAMSRCWSRFAAGLTEIEYRLRVGCAAFAPACAP